MEDLRAYQDKVLAFNWDIHTREAPCPSADELKRLQKEFAEGGAYLQMLTMLALKACISYLREIGRILDTMVHIGRAVGFAGELVKENSEEMEEAVVAVDRLL